MTGDGVPWDEPAILRAFEQWVWCPEGSELIDTGEYRLAFWPEGFGGSAHVERVETARGSRELIEEVHDLVRSRGVADVAWNVTPLTRPADLASCLVAQGATVRGEVALLARPVPVDGSLDLGPTPGVTVHPVTDVERLTHYRRIASEIFRQPMPGADAIEAEAARIDPDDPGGCRFLAYVDGTPAGTGMVGILPEGAAALNGAATLPAFRHRGAHRALLAARAQWAGSRGAPVMLVKGRVTTSAPTLLRVGFTLHGHQRELCVELRP